MRKNEEYYLGLMEGLIFDATLRSNRLSVFRFDLRFPRTIVWRDTIVIKRFVDSFKARLYHYKRSRLKKGVYTRRIFFSYIWVREMNCSDNWHYHFIFIFNKDAFFHFGKFDLNHENMSARIVGSWSSALGIDDVEAAPLVHFVKHVYPLNVNSEIFDVELEDIRIQLRYFAKGFSKDICDGKRNIGMSQTFREI